MSSRTITGTLSGSPRATVRFRQQAPFLSAGATYARRTVSARTDSTGAFSVSVPVPDSGTVPYRVELPDGSAADVNLGAGADTTIEALLTGVFAASQVTDTSAQLSSLLAAKVSTSRALTINGTAYDLSADRAWTVTGGQGMQQTTADRTGATNAIAQLQADLTTAVAAGHKRLYIPAGTYRLTTTSAPLGIFDMTADGAEVFGDGMGRTILLLDSSLALAGDVTIFRLTGRNQAVRDLTIRFGNGYTGTNALAGVSIYDGCFAPQIQRVEVDGGYGGGGSNGFGIGTYQPWNTNEIATTLGTVIAAGTRTVTPGSMAGIYVGRRMTIGGTAETVVVTARTETTFTATFANAHTAADSCTSYSQGNQYALIEDCYVHDGWKTTAYGCNSRNNTFRRNRAIATGSSLLYHGFYIQGGSNLFEGNYVAGARGYSFHNYAQVPNIDGSGNRYIGNVSINPTEGGHIIVQGTTNAANPDLPIGGPLTRYAIIQGNLFRNTNGENATGIWCNGVPCVVSGNVLEDVITTSGAGAIEVSGAGSSVTGNMITETGNASLGVPNYCGIRLVAAHITCTGNTITIANAGYGIRTASPAAGCVIANNTIYHSNASGGGLVFDGDAHQIANNRIELTAGATAIAVGTFTNVQLRGNYITSTGLVADVDLTGCTGTIADNVFGAAFRYTNLPQGVVFARNSGQTARTGQAGATLDAGSGVLAALTTTAVGQASGRLVKLAAGGIAALTTSDTAAVGVTTTATGAAAVAVLVATQPGAIVPIDCDGAWTAGNIGVPSTTSGGKIHDSGLTTAPASGSYVLFLDTGGGAGTARCQLMKLL